MEHISLTKQIGGIVTGFTSGALTYFSTATIFNAVVAGHQMSYLPLIGPAVLLTTAAAGSDEFYSEVKDSYYIGNVATQLGLIAFCAYNGNPVNFVAEGIVALVNNLALPLIADKLHEYTHPVEAASFTIPIHQTYLKPKAEVVETTPVTVSNDIELAGVQYFDLVEA